MRNHLIDQVTKLASIDDRIMLLTGDLGFGVLENFKNNYPNRFLNIGIAEQNMASIAAGLALEGNTVFTYSIGNFPTLRCIEQIRNNICYNNAKVIIVATGGGFAYGSLGMTHHATEDIAMMRALPNMKVYAPSDVTEALETLKSAYGSDGPSYIRLARGKEEIFHDLSVPIRVDLPITLSVGRDVQVLTTGTTLSEGVKLIDMLNNIGLSSGIASLPRIKPIDISAIENIAVNTKIIVTMEDHNIVGGLGGAISEILAEMIGRHAILLRIGLNDCFTNIIGSQEYLRDYYGISAKKVLTRIVELWNRINLE